MSFRINEHDGQWQVSRDGRNIVFDGEPIDFDQYTELKDQPHEAAKRFKRHTDGRIIEKTNREKLK